MLCAQNHRQANIVPSRPRKTSDKVFTMLSWPYAHRMAAAAEPQGLTVIRSRHHFGEKLERLRQVWLFIKHRCDRIRA
jgi:hypothetical protein